MRCLSMVLMSEPYSLPLEALVESNPVMKTSRSRNATSCTPNIDLRLRSDASTTAEFLDRIDELQRRHAALALCPTLGGVAVVSRFTSIAAVAQHDCRPRMALLHHSRRRYADDASLSHGTHSPFCPGAAGMSVIGGAADQKSPLDQGSHRVSKWTPELTSRRCTCRNAKSRCDEPRLTAGHYQAGNCWQDTSRASFLNTMHPREEKIMSTYAHDHPSRCT